MLRYGGFYMNNSKRYEKMKYRRVGKSGLLLPEISLGLWHNFGTYDNYSNMKKMCHVAFDNGITHFDLANNYGPEPGSAERNFGKILREDFRNYRDEMIISTKAGYDMWPGPYGNWGSRKYLVASLDQSLMRMGLDYVDIFYHHRMDPDTPLEETMGALEQIVRSGKALYVGLSNYDGPTMERAAQILSDRHVPFIINQNKYSIFVRLPEENGLLDSAVKNKKGVITFSPLAQGLLSDRYLNGIPEDSRIKTDGRFLKKEAIDVDSLNALNEIAQSRGQTLAQMALAWLMNKDAVTSVLIGASKKHQILDNIKAMENISFTSDELARIDAIADKYNTFISCVK
jgi:L-glyceraldehyde 3-phosphate reductase